MVIFNPFRIGKACRRYWDDLRESRIWDGYGIIKEKTKSKFSDPNAGAPKAVHTRRRHLHFSIRQGQCQRLKVQQNMIFSHLFNEKPECHGLL
jgi:hypothetical protein